ncbi:hypothetical protein EVAR_46759_1 [Eumeta japonica]|uniref:Uncharacterized protein n=1 Tax=Eumeta variegata TaxID=151549 RepID=A0A4C2AAB7_EUMVA|nr:hypothetical protein EVAR_46759_1 [Eumeta japonica]
MNECSFSVNYDKTVFTDSRSPSGGSRTRNGGWGYARGVRCDARVRRGSSRPWSAARDIDDEKKKKNFLSLNSVLTRIDQRVTAASGSILTVGQSAEPRAAAGAGSGGAVFCDTVRDDGDGDGDSAVWRSFAFGATPPFALAAFAFAAAEAVLRGGGGGSRCGRGGGGGLFSWGRRFRFRRRRTGRGGRAFLARRAGRGDRGGGVLPPPPALDEAAEDADLEPARFACSAYGDSTAPPPPPPEDFSNRKMT